ncbi:MAG: hypothetical protein RLZZ59_664, partial [Pseudomonadota bacterium]
VMMLDINIASIKASLTRGWPMGLLCLTVFMVDLIAIIFLGFNSESANKAIDINMNLGSVLNIGSVLYTKYMLQFQIAGLILFVAMVGCIALTLRHLTFVRRQNVRDQLARNKSTGMHLAKVKTGVGVKDIKY